MVTTESRPRPTLSSRFARFWADIAYVLPGFFISTFAFIVLVTLFTLSAATLVVWVGAVLLPLTLFIASGFADLSLRRLAFWGVLVAPATYAVKGIGLRGYWRWVADPRRWLDLIFETVIAFPLRLFTFCVAMTWLGGALGGLSWWSWGFYIPDGELRFPARVLEAITDGAAPDALTHSYAFESGCYFVIGAIFAVTLPIVMRGLAQLEAAVTVAALGAAAGSGLNNPESPAPKSGQDRERDVPLFGSSAAMNAVVAGRGLPQVSGEGWAWITMSFAAIVAVAVGWPVLGVVHGVPVAIAMVIVVLQAAALVLLVRWVWAGIGLSALAVLLCVLFAQSGPAPWPVTLLIGQVVLVFVVALRSSWPVAVAAWAIPQIAPVVSSFWAGTFPAGTLVVCLALSAGALGVGSGLRYLLRDRRALEEAEQRSEALSAERTELAERNRIAQELHDVVAHSMSVISVQATTAKYRLEDVNDDTAEEFASIAESSRKALTEMRGLLAVLRASGSEAPLVPQPGMDDITALVEASRRSGAQIEVIQRGELAGIPAATGLTAYRIVQEALSNAVRHSPGADIRVEVTADDLELTVLVLNGPASLSEPASPGAGLGIAGIRDRAAALGGAVEAGSLDGGGYRLRAVLPLG